MVEFAGITKTALPESEKRIADFDHAPNPAGWEMVQNAQQKAQEMKNDVTTVASKDLCETNDIHPPTKTKIAQRIAKALS